MRHVILVPLLVVIAQALALSSQEHLELGNAALKSADFTGALEQYHLAIDKDPKSFQTYFKRATVYLATGRTRQAIRDLSSVLELKPSFEQARTRRAELLIKEGSLDAARADYALLPNTPENQEIVRSLDNVEAHLSNGRVYQNAGNFPVALDAYTHAIESIPNDASLRLRRAECYMSMGQTGEAIGDVMRASKLRNNDPETYFLLSRLHFETGARPEAMAAIRECVKLDGDHKQCMAMYQKLKKFVKVYDKLEELRQHGGQYHEIIAQLEKAKAIDSTSGFFLTEYAYVECEAAAKAGQSAAAVTACTATLQRDPRRVDALLHRATAHEQTQNFPEAIADIKAAGAIEENSQRIQERLQRAERLQKQASKRDYYKILGVSRTATEKEIKKAYRDMASQWHPDKFLGEDEKKVAEKKFMDIAAAKEVLTDPNMRQLFDNGEDPLDAEENQQRQRNSNPFAHHHFHHAHHQWP